MQQSEIIFTVEDHNINGGLGSYISRLVCENAPRKVCRIALEGYGESGEAAQLADHCGFAAEKIAQRVRETMKGEAK